MIYLVRHGETTWNREGRRQGREDAPLTQRGIEQAREIGRRLHQELRDRQPVCIETSPLGRARHTATLICEELGVNPQTLIVSPLLMEHDMGEWQGLTSREIDAQYPGARQAREANKWTYVMPGGES
jgi:broad specificity phosphatase PhoE